MFEVAGVSLSGQGRKRWSMLWKICSGIRKKVRNDSAIAGDVFPWFKNGKKLKPAKQLLRSLFTWNRPLIDQLEHNCNIDIKPLLPGSTFSCPYKDYLKERTKIYFSLIILWICQGFRYAAFFISFHVWNIIFFLFQYLALMSPYSGHCMYVCKTQPAQWKCRQWWNKQAVEGPRQDTEVGEVNVKMA